MKNNSFQEIWNELKKHKKAIISLHSGPDGDSLGSCAAMKYALEKELKYKVYLISHDPLSESLESIVFANEIEFGKDITDVDLTKYGVLITLDSFAFNHIGKFKEKSVAPNNIAIINIDHHGPNDRFGTLNYIDSESPSTCSILVNLFKDYGIRFDSELSTRLLLGICTDTYLFKIKRENEIMKKLFEQTSFLMRNGARYSEILENTELNTSWKSKKYESLLIEKARVNLEKRYAHSSITKQEIEKLGLNLADIRLGIKTLFGIKDIDVVFTLAEMEDHIKGSFRSKSKVDVNEVTKELGGWGNKSAAAFRLFNTSLENAEEKVIQTLEKYL